jgi:hypothetical protein
MAQITQVKLVGDLDGGEAVESVAFSLDGKANEIDLSEKHAVALRDAFTPFIGGARRADNAAKVGSKQRMSTVRSTGSGRSRGETAAIREWANANGLEVSTRGRISSTVLEAFENRATRFGCYSGYRCSDRARRGGCCRGAAEAETSYPQEGGCRRLIASHRTVPNPAVGPIRLM